MADTLKCIVCYKTATRHTGHVLKGDQRVTAGWCDEHLNSYAGMLMEKYELGKGCHGYWNEKMGFRGSKYNRKELKIIPIPSVGIWDGTHT